MTLWKPVKKPIDEEIRNPIRTLSANEKQADVPKPKTN
jgi:hypothetical protein